MTYSITVTTVGSFSLDETCAPVAWGGGRWPNQDWIDGELVAVGRDPEGVIVRHVRQTPGVPDALEIRSNRDDVDHEAWARAVLGVHRSAPGIADPVIEAIASRFPGMRPYSNGSLFEGIVTAIIGQSISVQAAAITERKLSALINDPVEIGSRRYWPSPTAEQLANSDPSLVRQSGVTQRRADAIVEIARRVVDGRLPEAWDLASLDSVYSAVLALPQVGRWTAESVLLWGLGSDDSYPVGDVALLRAARLAYQQPTMTHDEMNTRSDSWKPGRSWAARWLWLALFGPAPQK